MPEPIMKWTVATGSPTQGYPSDGKLLKSDIATLSTQYESYKKSNEAKYNDVAALALGKACAALLPKAEALLLDVVKSFKAWKPKNQSSSIEPDIELCMGKLKKIERIMQKAAHYAVEPSKESAKGSDTLLLQRVCDVLRATIVVPSNSMFREDYGSAMIDIVNDAFGGKIVSVKNRFLLSSCPEIVTWDGKQIKVDTGLGKQLDEMLKLNLLGRDSFYRDMAMLIKLDDKTFPNQNGLEHVYLELQIASQSLHHAKSPPDKTEMSGHDAYRLLRTITEHAEYMMWTDNYKKEPALSGALSFYPAPMYSDWDKFSKYLEFMWNLYRANQKRCMPMWTAINHSKWYASSSTK